MKLLNSFQLKCIAIAMMIGGIVLKQVLNINVGYLVYLAAFPIADFLLVEAAKRTTNRNKLLLRLLGAAVLVELPMDIVTFGFSEWKNWGWNQNYFFTLAIGLGVIAAVEILDKKYESGTMTNNLLTLGIYLLAVCIAIFLRTEQGSVGVLTVVCLYLFYNNKLFSVISVAVLYLLFMQKGNGLECIAALSVLFVWLYNGEQGKANKITRMIFYLAFPIAYCVLGVLAYTL